MDTFFSHDESRVIGDLDTFNYVLYLFYHVISRIFLNNSKLKMGALTLKNFPFELRGWDIEKFESIDQQTDLVLTQEFI
jgi:hypothetical protein